MLAFPFLLTAGTCFFSSSSGDSSVVVITGDCTPELEMAGECERPAEIPMAEIARMESEAGGNASSAFALSERIASNHPEPAVPEPTAGLLFLIGTVAVARRIRR